METWKRAIALAPALLASAGCTYLADWTRTSVGLDENPVRTEYDDGRPSAGLARAGYEARGRLVDAIQALVNPDGAVATEGARVSAVFARAEEYYHVGRLAMRSQCESYMQTLASVDGQTTFGQDLANNFFDTATVAATVSQSPAIWATGLSATQNSFNSVSGSAERFLMLTESVGALRERVISRMEAAEGQTLDFDSYRTQSITPAVALDVARRSLHAVQRYGAPCTEAGIRLIISEALSTNSIAEQAQQSRYQSYIEVIQGIINETAEKDQRHDVDVAELRVLYLWAISAAAASSTDAGKVREQIEQVRLPYLASLTSIDTRGRLSFYVQQAAQQSVAARNDIEGLRTELLAAYRARTEQTPPPNPQPPEPPPAP